jgi:hypothetical protein
MKKINFNEFKNISLLKEQGGSWSTLYSAEYNNISVIIKAQNKGSLAKTNHEDDRFLQEKSISNLNIPNCVKCYGWGNNFNGERFLVYEKLVPVPKSITSEKAIETANTVLLASRQLYLIGFNWMSSMSHVMWDKDGFTKIIDFNDDKEQLSFFLEDNQYTDCSNILLELASRSSYAVTPKELKEFAIENMIKEEYISMENVHQPIYIDKYKHFLRRETERNDINYNKLVPANRLCTDRADILNSIDLSNIKDYLDIGGNIGWFTFYLKEKYNIQGTCLDFDQPGLSRPIGWNKKVGGKIEFGKLINTLKRENLTFINEAVSPDYMKNSKSYDLIMVLSLLHLFFSQHKVTVQYWNQLFVSICEKTNKILIFEVAAGLLSNLGLKSFEELADYAKMVGKFQRTEVVGMSDSKRPFIVCYK